MSTLETDRLSGDTEWIDMPFVERERTPRQLSKVGIQLRLAGLSLSSTEQHLESSGVKRSRTAIHNRVRKADLQPAIESTPNHVALDATVIRVDDQQRWLVAVTGSRWRPCVQLFVHASTGRVFVSQGTSVTSVTSPRASRAVNSHDPSS